MAAKEYGWYRRVYGDLSASGTVSAATGGAANVVKAPQSIDTLMIQRIAVNITTVGAQSITLEDTAGTPVVIGFIPASQAAGSAIVFDYGPAGIALTQGKNLSIVGTAAPAYSWAVEAYPLQTGTGQDTTVNRTV